MAETNTENDEQFDRIVHQYYQAVEAGETVQPEAFIRQHSEHENELRSFFADLHALDDLPGLGAMERTTDPSVSRSSHASVPSVSAGDRITYIGQYRLLEEIARGGMGVVFKAKQEKLGRVVALKMILSGPLASSTEIDRFRREARAAARLKHPNIVPVHEIGQHDAHYFFTMDFVESDSLADRLREGSLSANESARLVETIARAMHYAHGEGVLHRDLKPANILIDKSGQPHITDFGLAKAQAAADQETLQEMTRTGQILGTPSYMSPEQASGKSELVDVRSDVYSLGAVLYACLVGRAPFVGESSMETLQRVLHEDPPRVCLLNSRVPKDLETVCHKALSKEPQHRYGTAEELGNELARFLDGRPVLARPLPTSVKAWRWAKRNPAIAALSLLSVILLMSGTAISTSLAVVADRRADAEAQQRERADAQANLAREAQQESQLSLEKESAARAEAERARDSAAEAETRALDALDTAEAARRLAERSERHAYWQTYVAELEPMRQAWLAKEYGHLDRLLRDSVPAEGQADFRGWEWYFFQSQVKSVATPFANDVTFRGAAEYHEPTKRLFAWQNDLKNLTVWDVTKRQKIKEIELPYSIRQESLSISPNGKFFAIASSNREDPHCVVVDIDSGNVSKKLPATDQAGTIKQRKESYAWNTEWSPDGSFLITATRDGEVLLWDVGTWNLNRVIQNPTDRSKMGDLHWHPTAGLATGHRFGWARVWDTNSWDVTSTTKCGNAILEKLCWSPDGKTLALTTGGFGFWTPGQKEKPSPLGFGNGGVNSVVWLDNEHVALGHVDQQVTILRHGSDEPEAIFKVHSSEVKSLAKISDTTLLSAAANSTIQLINLRESQPSAFKRLPAHDRVINEVSWSPDGNRLATASGDRSVKIWDAMKHEVQFELTGFSHEIMFDVDWKWDGSELATVDHFGYVSRWDGDSGDLLLKKQVPEFDHPRLDWRPSRTSIAIGGQYPLLVHSDSLEVDWRLSKDKKRSTWRAKYVFSPEADRIAAVSSLGGWVNIVDPNDDLVVAQRRTHDRGDGASAWSPDGKLFVAAGTNLHLFSDQDLKPIRRLRGHRGIVGDVCFHPKGHRIASAGWDRDVNIWDVETGELLVRLPLDEAGQLHSIEWSPDGRSLAVGDGKGNLYFLTAFEAPEAKPESVASSDYSDKQIELDSLNVAISDSPRSVDALHARGLFHASLGNWSLAHSDMEAASKTNPYSGMGHRLAAATAILAGEPERFRFHLQHELDRLPDVGKGLNLGVGQWVSELANLQPDLTDPMPMLSLAQRHGDWHPENPVHVRAVALAKLRCGEPRLAIDLIDARLREDINIADGAILRLLKTLALQANGQPSASREMFQEAKASLSEAETWFVNNTWDHEVLQRKAVIKKLLAEAELKVQ